MKYIRTDKGQLYNLDDLYVTKLKGEPYGVKGSGRLVYKKNIIKQADTIDELCDAFVCITNKKKYVLEHDNKSFRQNLLEENKAWRIHTFDEEVIIAYMGAIWTSKGLIFVAEMDRYNGELKRCCYEIH